MQGPLNFDTEGYNSTLETLQPGMGMVTTFFSFISVTGVLVHVGRFHYGDIRHWFQPKPIDQRDVHTRTMITNYAPVPMWCGTGACFRYQSSWLFQRFTYTALSSQYGECWSLCWWLRSLLYQTDIIQDTTAISAFPRHFVCLLSGCLFVWIMPVSLFSAFSQRVVNQALLSASGCKFGHYFKIPPQTTF